MSYTTTITGSDLAIALSSTAQTVDLTKIGAQGASGLGITWEGAWATATVYNVNDAVYVSGNSYTCIVDHTSGTFATDLTASKWSLMATASDTPTFSALPPVVLGVSSLLFLLLSLKQTRSRSTMVTIQVCRCGWCLTKRGQSPQTQI